MRKLTIAALAALLFFSGLPYASLHGLVYLLDRQLDIQVQIEDVDLNLFTGKMAIKNLIANGQHNTRGQSGLLAGDLDMWQLLQGRLEAESIELNGVELDVVQSPSGDLVVLLTIVQESASEDTDKTVSIPLFALHQFDLHNSVVHVDAYGISGSFQLERLSLAGLSTLHDRPGQLRLKAAWEGSPVNIEGELSPLSEIPWFQGHATLKRLELAHLHSYLPEAIPGLDGQLSLALDGRVAMDQVATKLELTLEQLDTTYNHLKLSTEHINWSGKLQFNAASAEPVYQLQGDLNIAQLSLNDPERNLDLLSLASAELTGLSLDQALSVHIDRALLSDMGTVGNADGRLLNAGEIALEHLDYRDNLLSLQRIHSTDFVSSLSITADGQLASQGVLTASLQALQEEAAEQQAPIEPLQWSIGELLAERGVISFRDENFRNNEVTHLKIMRLSLGPLSSTAPQAASPLNFEAGVGEYGRIVLNGHLSALDPLVDTKLDGNISSLPLPLLSPYAESLLGYELKSGQFDHELKLTLANNHIDASNKIKLRKITVGRAPDTKPTAPLPIPLELALNMLRDSKDNVELSIPLKGSLDDPAVGLDQIVSTALGKALTAGSTTYLKLALQPYGAIWMGAEMGLKLAGRMRLDPMSFPPMQDELTKQQLDYAAKLATLLKERPKIELKACGIAGTPDFTAYKQQLLAQLQADAADLASNDSATSSEPIALVFPAELHSQHLLSIAKNRAAALKRKLVTEHGISDRRIYLCRPAIDAENQLSGVKMHL